MNGSTRPTRSRVSSPFISGSKNTATETSTKSAEGSKRLKTFLDKWVEPDRATPRPSFAEAGLERHNVVLNMAPLGTLPSHKIRKSLLGKSDGSDGNARPANSRKLAPSAVSTSDEPLMTPEPPTTSQRKLSVSTNKTEERLEETLSTPIPQTPQQVSSPRKSVSRRSVHAQSPGQGVFALHRSPLPSNHTPTFRPAPTNSNGLASNDDLRDKVVENAVQEALDRYRYPTAYALRTIYDEHRKDFHILQLFDSIISESATDDQRMEFNRIMKHRKRLGKKDRTAEYYFNGDGSDPAPRLSILQTISAIDPGPVTYVSPYATSPFAKTSQQSTPVAKPVGEPGVHVGTSSWFNSTPTTADANDMDHEHIRKKPKLNNFHADNYGPDENQNGAHRGDGDVVMSDGYPPDEETNEQAAVGNAEHSRQGIKKQFDADDPSVDDNGQKISRSRSNSSTSSLSSSLSSINEAAIAGAFASAKNSPAVKYHAKKSISLGSGLLGSGNGNGFGPAIAPPTFVSPYTDSKNFSAIAETVVRNSTQPIMTGPKIHTFAITPSTSASSSSAAAPPSSSTNTSVDASTNADHQSSTNPSMAPAVLASTLTTSSSTTGSKCPPTLKIKNFKSHKSKGNHVIDENDDTFVMKHAARERAQANYNPLESYERHQVTIASSQDVESESDGQDSMKPVPSKRPMKKSRDVALKTRTRETRHSSNRSIHYDSEDNNLSSPTILGFHPNLAPGSTPSSRAATPSVASRQPTRKAKAGTGLRVKSSPIKKRGGTSAGIPRSGERHQSPLGNGASATQDAVENDDFCSACGGNGDLVCCDGHNCPRSFHFRCVDPPLINDLPDEWFCNECNPPQRPPEDYKGAFRELLQNLDSKCPRAFSLPPALRDYFEYVKTGNEGEYEEIQPPKPKTTKGWEEAPDYFRLKDAKGNAIFCHACAGQAEPPARSIITCTFCGLYWHMDCLPVPLAREPAPGRSWQCPAHVDDVLAKLPDSLGPAHRFRKIKGAPVIKPAFSRGLRNNGHIEIDNEPSDKEDDQVFYEQKEFGNTYKLPEKGIKLDFITKIKESRGNFQRDLPQAASRKFVTWNKRSVEEQQAALNLASMIPQTAIPDSASRLINALVTEAPPTVLTLLAQGSSDSISAGKLTRSDIQSMETVLEIIKARLAAAETTKTVPLEGSTRGVELDLVGEQPAAVGHKDDTGKTEGDSEMLL